MDRGSLFSIRTTVNPPVASQAAKTLPAGVAGGSVSAASAAEAARPENRKSAAARPRERQE